MAPDPKTLCRNWWGAIAVCLSVVVVIHFIPKGWMPGDPWRLFYCVSYFSSVLVLLALMLGPRRRCQRAASSLQYASAPLALQRAVQKYHHRRDQVISNTVWILMAFVGSTACATLACWFPRLAALSLLYDTVWWLSIGTMILFPMFGNFLFKDLGQRYLDLQEHLQLETGFDEDSNRPNQPVATEPESLKILPDFCFRAGGLDWSWRDLQTNSLILGRSGAGKTVCVLNSLLEGILGSADQGRKRLGGLILDPKGDFRDKITVLCRKYGRERDLYILDPNNKQQPVHWNPFDSTDDELELSSRFAAVMETLGMQSENSFWIDTAQRFIRHSLWLIRATNPLNKPPGFRDLLRLAVDFKAIADRTDQVDLSRGDCEEGLVFFQEWMMMASNQRSGVLSHVTNMIDPFLMEPYATVFSGRSTCRLADVAGQGKILYVYMPLEEKRMMARMIGTFLKLEYYREVLRALNKPNPSFFLCDEFQQFFTSSQRNSDADFFERSRQSNHANFIATLSLPSLARQSKGREAVQSLLAQCSTKIFLRNDDQETNDFGSKLFGERIMSLGAGQDQLLPIISPDRFKELAIVSDRPGVKFCESLTSCSSRPEGSRAVNIQKWLLHPIVPSRSNPS